MSIKAYFAKLNETVENKEGNQLSISSSIDSSQTPTVSPPSITQRRENDRPLLEPFRNYTVPEAAMAIGVAAITIWRALESGHLKCYRVGRRVICNGGQHLIPWLEAGGKTSRI
ncbi:MAG: hypothetical protein JNM09_09525 [Blastocatellia bacterium]|nr:hypothetical protein [Blastocatellia bacterium]